MTIAIVIHTRNHSGPRGLPANRLLGFWCEGPQLMWSPRPALGAEELLQTGAQEAPGPPQLMSWDIASAREVIDGRDGQMQQVRDLGRGHHLVPGQGLTRRSRIAFELDVRDRRRHGRKDQQGPADITWASADVFEDVLVGPRTSSDIYTSFSCKPVTTRGCSPIGLTNSRMGNDNLRNALSRAGISADELADLIKVDPRTVRRWLTGQPPYPRHRVKIARALDLTEHDLWPEVAATADEAAGQKTTGETLIGYADAEHAVPRTMSLISSATERIELLDDTLFPLLKQPGIAELLISKASQGCLIRILIAQPLPSLAPLLNQPGISIQVFEGPDPVSIHRSDRQMLVTIRLDGLLDKRPMLLHLTQRAAAGVFDRLAEHYQKVVGRSDRADQDCAGHRPAPLRGGSR